MSWKLLGTQRDDGVDAGGAAGGEPASEGGDTEQHRGSEKKREWVERAHAEEHFRQGGRRSDERRTGNREEAAGMKRTIFGLWAILGFSPIFADEFFNTKIEPLLKSPAPAMAPALAARSAQSQPVAQPAPEPRTPNGPGRSKRQNRRRRSE